MIYCAHWTFSKNDDMQSNLQTGVLLINLGTPDDTSVKSVRRYLREFLNDPRVIDLPFIARSILVNGIIVPFRAKSSAKAYREIWQAQGSPLLIHSKSLADKVQLALGKQYKVALGMRYGNPSIQSALDELKSCQALTIIPLFGQYASASNGSAIEKTLALIQKQWNLPSIRVINAFHDDPGFIKASADIIADHTKDKQIDKLLLSFHGVPERHITKSACHGQCDKKSPCPKISEQNLFCYRAHCYETARLIAQALNLSDTRYTVAFQSRLGKIPWIQPYTDILLKELYEQGVRNLAVACPSFVADCLETLEEIGMRLKEDWQNLGGETFTLIPCLNDDDRWVKALCAMVQ